MENTNDIRRRLRANLSLTTSVDKFPNFRSLSLSQEAQATAPSSGSSPDAQKSAPNPTSGTPGQQPVTRTGSSGGGASSGAGSNASNDVDSDVSSVSVSASEGTPTNRKKGRKLFSGVGTPDYLAPEILLGIGHSMLASSSPLSPLLNPLTSSAFLSTFS